MFVGLDLLNEIRATGTEAPAGAHAWTVF